MTLSFIDPFNNSSFVAVMTDDKFYVHLDETEYLLHKLFGFETVTLILCNEKLNLL